MRLTTKLFFLLLFFSWGNIFSQDFISNIEPSRVPLKISNNAVTGAILNGTPYVYSFAGIDSSKNYAGIHLKSFRYNTLSQIWDTIPDLPDTKGKIAPAASTIDSIIYIMGGYYVDRRGHETSSNLVHRYNTSTNSYLSDGAPIPVPIDDHVQATWKDSLIFVITGWSNSGNVPNVQIYYPRTNTWVSGNPVPNNNTYKSFGASGTIVNNTIYYFGGASGGTGFPCQNILRIGDINPSNPTLINWRDTVIDPSLFSYRAACIGNIHGVNWIGGSEITYNYNGIAYNGSGGVSASNRNRYYNLNDTTMNTKFIHGDSLPMDLRGIADFGNTAYIVGGMVNNQKVTNKVWKLNYQTVSIPSKPDQDFYFYPNPASSKLIIKYKNKKQWVLSFYSSQGALVRKQIITSKTAEIDITNLDKGMYFIQISSGDTFITKKLFVQ